MIFSPTMRRVGRTRWTIYYRKSVLHLLKHMVHVHLSICTFTVIYGPPCRFATQKDAIFRHFNPALMQFTSFSNPTLKNPFIQKIGIKYQNILPMITFAFVDTAYTGSTVSGFLKKQSNEKNTAITLQKFVKKNIKLSFDKGDRQL